MKVKILHQAVFVITGVTICSCFFAYNITINLSIGQQYDEVSNIGNSLENGVLLTSVKNESPRDDHDTNSTSSFGKRDKEAKAINSITVSSTASSSSSSSFLTM